LILIDFFKKLLQIRVLPRGRRGEQVPGRVFGPYIRKMKSSLQMSKSEVPDALLISIHVL
jgi:hypothetical protein